MGVTVYSTFTGWCDCLEHFYEWVWVGVTGCGWVWVVVTGCRWVGKMVKPAENQYGHKDSATVHVEMDSARI